MKDPKCLVLDIETSPIIAYVWGRQDQNIALNQIKDEWHVMAWAAKWLGDPPAKVRYLDKRKQPDDKGILQSLWYLLDEADILITQNGKNFDSPKINARFLIHGMPPPSPYKHLDTYQIARSAFKLTSNKLEYMTDKLCTKYKKLPHKRFPGFSLWSECLKGNIKAWDEMKKYNIHDVLSTEELYLKLRAWAPQSAPDVYTNKYPEVICRICGKSGKMHKAGIHITKTRHVQRWKCNECGSFSLGAKIK